MMVKKILLSLATVLAVLISGVSQANDLVIGAKGYAEQQLLAEMTSQLLKKNGYSTKQRTGLGGSLMRQAMENGQVDVCWEYTGTSLITYNKINDKLGPEETYQRVKELDAKKGIVWLNSSKANNTYVIARRKGHFNEINSLSDLAKAYKAGKKLKMAVSAEFIKRVDGLDGLQKAYDFNVGRDNLVTMHTGLVYQALNAGEVDLAMVFATDGRIAAFNFVALQDDRVFFPDYAMAPNVRKEILDANPEVGKLLNRLSAVLDNGTMQRLNAQVSVDNISVEKVAERFLKEQGMI